ncbi:MAG: MBL fold metallo-hydrolase [Bacteroidetes bacterium]|nr:MBL fold metallo-hydrolase [Bacteroidota bacterium]
MPDVLPGTHLDPMFPDYAYTSKALVKVYKGRSGSKGSANLFLGEWTKILDKEISSSQRIHVRYRGGKGYIEFADLSRDRQLEIFFIDVSQGDSILIQTPNDRRILIDGGETEDAHDFIRNKYHLDKSENYIDFDAVVATHSDADHTKGLLSILSDSKIAVKRFFHNGLFRRTDKAQDPGHVKDNRIFGLIDRPGTADKANFTPLMKKLADAIDKAEKNLPVVIKKMKDNNRRVDIPENGFICKRFDAADGFLPPFDDPAKQLSIEILWPKAVKIDGKLSYPWYGDAGKTVNGNSIAFIIKLGSQKILLSGDLNEAAMDDMLRVYPSGIVKPSLLESRVYKAAHHGSQDFSVPFLQVVKPDAAVISSGDDRSDIHGHPRAVLLGTITRYSRCEKPAVFSTELAACFTRLSKKELTQFKLEKGQLYERHIQGIIHLRSDGNQLYLGSVHGLKSPKDPLANIMWKWDVWP